MTLCLFFFFKNRLIVIKSKPVYIGYLILIRHIT